MEEVRYNDKEKHIPSDHEQPPTQWMDPLQIIVYFFDTTAYAAIPISIIYKWDKAIFFSFSASSYNPTDFSLCHCNTFAMTIL